ncbi:restriction endonuclease subunit S [Vreelandella glaciei]|uniref:restriction endonuclease subunit S n=1 Tax=Vreelandella glaciei TaxID=186761 RepID=UPI0030EF7CB4|tara:strand:+ start:4722 stop:5963 length:1242 start_codon:yes stop_codon:yes gene_type:complete
MSEKQALVPRLRFPEFRDAGEWEFKKLGDKDISSFVKKRVSVSDLDLDSYVSTENILPDFGGIKGASKLPPSGSFTSYKPEDILIANIRPYLKKVWVADRDGAASNDVVVVRPMKGIKGSFLSALLRSEVFIDYVMKGAKGVKMPRGDVSLMKDYSLAVPCPKEQQKIADCLSCLDELIAAQMLKIDALKTHKKGLMQQLFPRESETVPRLRFPEFWEAEEWEEKTIGKIGEVVTGNTPSTTNRNYYGGDIMFASPADISESRFVSKTSKTLSSEGLAIARNIPAHSILFVCIGSTIGKVAQNAYECATNQQINVVIPFDEYVNSFIYFALNFSSAKMATLAGKQAVPIINKSLFSSSVLVVPSDKEEQQKIGDCLSSLDALIAAQVEKIDALKTHKKGLMQQLFPSVESIAS